MAAMFLCCKVNRRDLVEVLLDRGVGVDMTEPVLSV